MNLHGSSLEIETLDSDKCAILPPSNFVPDNLAQLATATYSLHQFVSSKRHSQDLKINSKELRFLCKQVIPLTAEGYTFFRPGPHAVLLETGVHSRDSLHLKHEKSRPREAVEQVYAEHYDADSESPVQYASAGDASTVPAASHAAGLREKLKRHVPGPSLRQRI